AMAVAPKARAPTKPIRRGARNTLPVARRPAHTSQPGSISMGCPRSREPRAIAPGPPASDQRTPRQNALDVHADQAPRWAYEGPSGGLLVFVPYRMAPRRPTASGHSNASL